MTATLYRRIGQFYDAASPLWEKVWGEHMHHGYYGPKGTQRKDRYQAQIDLMEALLEWGQIETVTEFLDAGCGIGGSTLYLAQKYGARGVGITLSSVQAQRAQERVLETLTTAADCPYEPADPGPRASFQVANALATGFPDQSFDLIWSLESGEHMPDKRAFLEECYRQLKPGGRLLMATWCHRPTDSLAGPLTASETRHLDNLYQVYHLPYVLSLPEYRALAQAAGFENLRTADWSNQVEYFWTDVITSALDPQVALGILEAGPSTIQGALALNLMLSGFQRGLIRFGLLYGEKA